MSLSKLLLLLRSSAWVVYGWGSDDMEFCRTPTRGVVKRRALRSKLASFAALLDHLLRRVLSLLCRSDAQLSGLSGTPGISSGSFPWALSIDVTPPKSDTTLGKCTFGSVDASGAGHAAVRLVASGAARRAHRIRGRTARPRGEACANGGNIARAKDGQRVATCSAVPQDHGSASRSATIGCVAESFVTH